MVLHERFNTSSHVTQIRALLSIKRPKNRTTTHCRRLFERKTATEECTEAEP